MEGWTDGMTDRKTFGKRCNDRTRDGLTERRSVRKRWKNIGQDGKKMRVS